MAEYLKDILREMIKSWVWKNHPSYDQKELIITEEADEYHIRVNESDTPLILKKPDNGAPINL